jgi:D-galactarolactone cycloisomerase
MKITDIRVRGPSAGYLTLVEVHTDQGLTGIGATDAPPDVSRCVVEHGTTSLKSLLVGEDPRDPRRLWRKMFVRWQARRGRASEGGFAVNAMAAVDLALWDLAGKARGKPIYELLGGAVQPQVMAYASSSLFRIQPDGSWRKKSGADLVRQSRSYVEQGFRAIKFGWGNNFAKADEKRIAAIREAIGPKVRLMVDFGCPAYWTEGWNAAKAIRAARLLEKYGLYFLEEALLPHDVEGFATLSKTVKIRIASGESLTTVHQFEPFIERHALDIVQPDAQQLGVTQFHEIARNAAAAGILCMPHGPWTSTNIAAHVNLLATEKNGEMVEYPAPDLHEDEPPDVSRIFLLHVRDLVEKPIQLKDGFLQLPTAPGLGVGGFVEEALRRLESLCSK